MMRHWVNFGLILSFLALSVSGVMAYMLPFSIIIARVHIIFGGLTILLIAFHIASRTRYFAKKVSEKGASRKMITGVATAGTLLLGLALTNLWPVNKIVDASYEARRKAEIVRSSPLAGHLDVDNTHRFVARKPGPDANTAVSLMVRFQDGLETTPAIAVWAETNTGTIIETLYLDEALAFGENVTWQGTKIRRHELLPIWRHRYTVVSGVDPHGIVDAFTASTPEHSLTLDQYLDIDQDNGFVLCVEINSIGDPNESYPDPILGQPSLLYTAFIQPGRGNPYSLLELTAHGGIAIEEGSPGYDFTGIDTAMNLIDLLLVKTGPAKP